MRISQGSTVSLLAMVVATASSLPFASLAMAQAPAEADASSTEIVVTATRDARSLKDVPMSVDVATGEDLQKLNLFDAKDISFLAPGLELTNTSGRNNTTTLRGVTFDPDQGTGPAVQTYFNEVPTDAQFAFTALYDIQQIEVLRGPQGLLRGLSAPAGSITIASRKPTFGRSEGYVQTTVTDEAGYNLQGGVTAPLSDQFSVRIAGLIDGNRLNNVSNVTRNERSRSRTESGRITLGWRPTNTFSAYLTYQYLHADNRLNAQVFGPGNAPVTVQPFVVGQQVLAPGFSVPIAVLIPSGDTRRSGPPADVSDYIAVAQQPQRFKNTFHFANLAFDWDLGPATLSFVGAHQDAKLRQQRDLDPGNAVVDPTPVSTVFIPNRLTTGEVRLHSNEDEGFGWGVGAFYTRRRGTVEVNQDANSYAAAAPFSAGLLIPINTRVVVPVANSTASFNANLRYKGGGFTIEGGLRYSIIKNNQTTDIFVTSPGGQVLVPVGGGANLVFPVGPINSQIVGVPPSLQRSKDTPLTGGLTVSYELTPEFTAYGAYGHSFRSGTTGVSTPVGISADLIRTDSEKTDSFEIGLKGAVLDRRVNFAVAAFYQKLDGFLSRFDGIFYNCPDVNGVCGGAGSAPINNATDQPPTNGAFSFNYNGDATIKGLELSVDGRFTDNWDFGLNMSYADAKYDGAVLPCNDFAGTGQPNQTGAPRVTGPGNVSYCANNGRLAEVPKFGLTANSEIRAPMGNVTPFLRGLLTYRPGFFSRRVNFDYPSRTNLNLYLGVRGEDDRWEVNVFAKNVLDQKRITNISLGNAVVGPYDSGYRLINATNPREFGLTGSFKF